MTARLRLAALAIATLGGIALAAGADDASDAVAKLSMKLMQTTKVVAITDVATPDKFSPDNDPDTLQIVYLTDPNAGKSHVSDDGEVIYFVGDPDISDQQPYIFKAFEIRAKRRLGAK